MDENIIIACKKNQREAQRLVYEQMATKLYYTCKRYLKKEEEIEEVLADTFYIIFTKILIRKNGDFYFFVLCFCVTINKTKFDIGV